MARPTPGGFALSGQWRLPAHDGTGPWLVLTLAPARNSAPDPFVVAANVLPGGLTGGTAPAFRLEDVYVPAGFVTHSAGHRCGPGTRPSSGRRSPPWRWARPAA
ncbi:hypothetical protein [Streptomyces sp. NL15-2K]|uniref:hypothetical protein n=1 Tax=Streptomyces sp. NL15-2K TaxID=376149 RepID=UPI00209C5E1F|nr:MULTISPECIES: hypothetical protein [Actinomycetes]WKX13811.1 hypothetical protein Q4V64_42290 [Kutzneria buriramensis]